MTVFLLVCSSALATLQNLSKPIVSGGDAKNLGRNIQHRFQQQEFSVLDAAQNLFWYNTYVFCGHSGSTGMVMLIRHSALALLPGLAILIIKATETFLMGNEMGCHWYLVVMGSSPPVALAINMMGAQSQEGLKA